MVQMLLRRLLTFAIVIGVCVATASPSLAIEKHKKDTPAPKSDTTAVAKPQPQPQPQTGKVSDTLKTPVQRSIPPVFNDFIDVNMNGIDDRREQGGYLIPLQQAPKTPVVVRKADSTKTAIPKPAAEKPKKKDK
jgi:hypothetical protein